MKTLEGTSGEGDYQRVVDEDLFHDIFAFRALTFCESKNHEAVVLHEAHLTLFKPHNFVCAEQGNEADQEGGR